MLEKFVVFSRTGVVLFSIYWNALKVDVLGHLVRDVLLPARPGTSSKCGEYTLKWTESHAEGLVFCAVLHSSLEAKVPYAGLLLSAVQRAFVEKHGESFRGPRLPKRCALPPLGEAALSVVSDANEPVTEVDAFAFGPIFKRCHEAAEKSGDAAPGGGSSGAGAKGAAAASRASAAARPPPSSSSAAAANAASSRQAGRAGAAPIAAAAAADDDDDDDDDGLLADEVEKKLISAGGGKLGGGSSSPPPASPSQAASPARSNSASSSSFGGASASAAVEAPSSPSSSSSSSGSASSSTAAAGGDAAVVDEDAEIAAARAAARGRLLGGGKGGVSRSAVGGSKSAASLSAASSPAGSSSKKSGSLGLAALPANVRDVKHTKEAEARLSANAAGGVAEEVAKVEYRYDGSSGSGRDLDEDDADLVERSLGAAGASAGSGASSSSSAAAGGAGSSSSSSSSWFSRSFVGSFLSSVASKLTGTATMSAEDLSPALEALKNHLIAKNVSADIASQLVDKVGETLVGKPLGIMSNVEGIVSGALREAISQILTPKRNVDVLAEVRAKKDAGGGPYIVVFVGVNGVGKSTTLSKVAYHMRENRHSVLIAACDSFRTGAVEQLQRHCAALDVPLYHQSYGKDPIQIAAAAVRDATTKGLDVVLVDTAGRMQSNAPLMTQIAMVVAVNKPDLVLFVGEALVGNDGVDQLMEFDRALVDHAVDPSNPRRIDGIVLTKFDTIDDKVGAALSMAYKSLLPIVFLGTGQKYTNLKKLNVSAVVKALMA